MTLEEAGAVLSEVTGKPLRSHLTVDFGREQQPLGRSVIIAEDVSRELLTTVRGHIGPGIVAFIGTTSWLGDERHDGVELVVAEGASQFDILRIARSDAVNFDMDAEQLIRKLQQYDEQVGIDIFHAETDTIEAMLLRSPDDMQAFAEDVYEFCPDIVDQGLGSVEELAKSLEHGHLFLWWD